MESVFFSALLAASSVTSSLSIACPPAVSIKPCSCMGSGSLTYTINIICTEVKSLDEFVRVLPAMKGYKIDTLHLQESNVTHLHSDTFKGLDVRSIKLSYMKLTGLADGVYRPPFMGLESSLEELEIQECFSDRNYPLPRLDLTHLKKLTKLKLEGNVIRELGNDWFESGPYGLRELTVYSSGTKRLGSHAFASLSNLKKLSYTGGTLTTFTRDMLPSPAHHLQYLELSNNNISSLPRDIFIGLPSLEEVYFEANSFTVINELVWGPVWNQLTHVYFFANPIHCDENIKWIYKYRLPEIFGGTCAKPDSIRGKALSSLTIKDFN